MSVGKQFATDIQIDDQVLIDLFANETEEQGALRELTRSQVEHHHMMTTPDQVNFLQLLIRSIRATRAIEVGVFTGYATLALAQALPSDGQLIACDQNDTWPRMGEPFWEKAGVRHKIDLQIAPALETLQALLDEGYEQQFDFIFIDADKINYSSYFVLGDKLLRDGGLLVFDNTLRIHEQRVAEEKLPATRAVASLLRSMSQHPGYQSSLVPMAEGMLIAHKAD